MMKALVTLKMPILLCGLGAALMFTPACKAQSEIAPDHFDGGDTAPWETVRSVDAPKINKTNPKAVAWPVHTQKSNAGPTVQVAAAREATSPAGQGVVAIQDKRKTAVRKSTKP
jgi:hypothetical protein